MSHLGASRGEAGKKNLASVCLHISGVNLVGRLPKVQRRISTIIDVGLRLESGKGGQAETVKVSTDFAKAEGRQGHGNDAMASQSFQSGGL